MIHIGKKYWDLEIGRKSQKIPFLQRLPLILWPIYNRNCHLPLANMQKKRPQKYKSSLFFYVRTRKMTKFLWLFDSFHSLFQLWFSSSYDLSVYVVDFSWTLMTCVFGSKTVLTSILEQIMEFLVGGTKIKWPDFERLKASNDF